MPSGRSSRRVTLGAVSVNSGDAKGPGGDASKKPAVSKSRQRMSMAPRVNVNGSESLLSARRSKGGENSVTPGRRKSGDKGKRQLVGAVTSSAAPRVDQRPISDKAFQSSCMRSVMQYLESSGYEHPISMKILSRPSTKHFNQIVTFLLRKVDPNLAFQTSGSMKFEEEVALAFKGLRYPFPLSKTALVAVGSPHTWPSLLAALSWLVEAISLLEAHKQAAPLQDQHRDQDQDQDQDQPLEDTSQLTERSDRAFYTYIADAYEAFLRNDDDLYNALEEELVENYEADNMKIEREIERITHKSNHCVQQIEALEQRADVLPEIEKKREDLCVDLEKFHELVKQLNQHKATLDNKVQERSAELHKNETSLAKTQEKLQHIREKLSVQELSVNDVENIQREKRLVQDQTDKITADKLETNKILWKSEMDLNQKFDELQKAVALYNSKAADLLLIPATEENARGTNYKADVHRDHANDCVRLLGVDLEHVILPALMRLKKEYLDDIETTKRKLHELRKQEEATKEAIEKAVDREKIIKSKLKKSEETLKQEKQMHEAAYAARIKEIESVKETTFKDPVSFESAMVHHKSRRAHLEVVYRQVIEEGTARKKEVQEEINMALSVCADHKEYVQLMFEGLEQYLKEKVEKVEKVQFDCDVDE